MTNKEGYVKVTSPPLILRPFPCGEKHWLVESIICGDVNTNYLCGYCQGRKRGREERDAYWQKSVEQLVEHDNVTFATGKEEGRLEAAKEIHQLIGLTITDWAAMRTPTVQMTSFHKGMIESLCAINEQIESEFGVGK